MFHHNTPWRHVDCLALVVFVGGARGGGEAFKAEPANVATWLPGLDFEETKTRLAAVKGFDQSRKRPGYLAGCFQGSKLPERRGV